MIVFISIRVDWVLWIFGVWKVGILFEIVLILVSVEYLFEKVCRISRIMVVWFRFFVCIENFVFEVMGVLFRKVWIRLVMIMILIEVMKMYVGIVNMSEVLCMLWRFMMMMRIMKLIVSLMWNGLSFGIVEMMLFMFEVMDIVMVSM